ncbi:MAG: shikimate dehydrogenase [Chloroflexota bacterium]
MIKLGLIGYPLGHSLSPKIHKAALKSCHLQGDYSLFPIHPDDLQGLKDLLARVRDGELYGLNVTIPHKQNVIPLLDELTPTADTIGAVNTISMQNGILTGDNTDAPGFLADLKKFLTTETRRYGDKNSALVLGAGGGARAVVYALVNAGWNVTITDIHPKQTEALVAHFSFPESRLTSIEYRPAALHSFSPELTLIVNATPVGMSPNVENSPWPESLPFPSCVSIYDLVYNPSETKLVKDARAAGLPAITGLGMLIEQAALAFEVWTGCAPSRDALIAAIN